MNFTQFVLEKWESHDDLMIANSASSRKRISDELARRKAVRDNKNTTTAKKPIAPIAGSAPKAALPSGGGALVKSPPQPSALVKTPKPPTPPKLPKPRPQIKLPKPGPMHINRKKGGDLSTVPEKPETNDGGDNGKHKKHKPPFDVDRENRFLRKFRDVRRDVLLKGPEEVGVAMGRDLEGAPQRNRGI